MDSVVTVPDRAEVVVIGGGAVGCSVAYHLAQLGMTDVALLEQGELSCGTTWHAAGIVGQVRASASLTRLARYSLELYARLEAETGFSTGWRPRGAIWLAQSDERVTHLARAVSAARVFGTAAEFISPKEAQERFPLLEVDDLKAAVWLPEDGTVNPSDLTQALARGATAKGVRICERVKVLSINLVRGRVTSVSTSHGEIECERVVIAAGQWSKAIGDSIGVPIPLYPAQHFYVVTEFIEGMDRNAPILRDPDSGTYFKEEVGGLLVGCFEPDALAWVRSQDIPEPFQFQLLDENWDHFAPMLENGVRRIPALASVGLKKLYNGPESFTADNQFIIGEAPQVGGVFVAAGFNSGGIANAGGAGLALAEWIVNGGPTRDLWTVDIARFAPFSRSDRWLRERTIETLGDHYALPWPNRELETGRGVRRSPVHHIHESLGACFGSKLGWERVNWYASSGSHPEVNYSFGRQNWHDNVAREAHATRNGVAVFDQTAFSKFVVAGPDAELALQWICANDLSVPVGRVTYTAMLNERGGFESDLTVTRLSDEEFFVVSGTAQQVRDFTYIRRQMPDGLDATISDVTSAFAVFSVMGPLSRALMSQCSFEDFSASAFPFGWSRWIDLGDARVMATRMTYVGELGWELYVPVEMASGVYQYLLSQGAGFGITPAGYYAIESLRLEKGYRAWGRDVTPDVTPAEAGLLQFCKLDSSIPFRGRKALEEQLLRPLSQRLVDFEVVHPEASLWGGEVLLINDQLAGPVTSAAFGHTLGKSVGIALVNDPTPGFDWINCQDLWVQAGGDRFKAQARSLGN
ncbi:MAG: FAD-dependent oxidoreductase [Actinobacteria bacterium]|nr:FAD-dependent oxidoreductase [Actinomycetota bacterium]